MPSPIPVTSRQMILVRTADWNNIHGTLQRFERSGSGETWKPVSPPEAIVVGRTGLAWGIGLHGDSAIEPGPVKREGDGKSPAGVFRLSEIFGYAPGDSLAGLHMPYIQATEDLKCVDDSEHGAYNTLIKAPAVGPVPWKSAEDMRRKDEAYRIGVFVDHNAGTQRRPGAGSCIFLHVWGGADHPTVGCTAMPIDRMLALAQWLDRSAQPVLVQLPEEEYALLKPSWRLP
ncbi:MAG: L,D-transpeptidase family protein [Gemmatimonadota bacterium]